MRRTVFLAVVVAVLGSLAMAAAGCSAAGGGFPNKSIEFVVQAAPGGGSDINARGVADILAKEKIVNQSIAVVNKAEGGGTEAYIYLGNKKGDAHTIATATVTYITNPLQGQAPYSYKDFTNLVNLCADPFVVLVNSNSKIGSFKDLIDTAKKAPKSVSVGGSRVGADDHILSFLIARETGVEFNFIAYKSGGEVMTALLGNQIDMASANPGEAVAQVEGKKARALATSAPQRLPSLPDVPTLKELGLKIEWMQFRGWAAPPGIPQEQRTFWENAFEKMVATDSWKAFLKQNEQVPDFRKGADFEKYLADLNAKYDDALSSLGLIKKK